MPPAEEIEPGLLVEEVVRLVRNRHPMAKFTFTDDLAGTVVLGSADGLRIDVENLLTNAATHAGPDTTVDVKVATVANSVLISVADEGPGIPVEQRDYLRGRFTRGTGVLTPGTGLGLALV